MRFGVVVVAACAIAVGAQLPAVAAQGGTVSGTVRDAATGVPLSACVYARAVDGSGASAAATSNAFGNYSVALPAGRYAVEFTDCSSSPSKYLDEWWQGHLTGPGDPVTVVDGSDTSGIDADMQLAGSISGTVTEAATGLPLAGVQIQLRAADFSGVIDETAFPTTDQWGHYTAGGLGKGSYYVWFGAPAGGPDASEFYPDVYDIGQASTVAVTNGQDHAGIDGHLAHGTISGRVVDASGNPVVGDSVVAEVAGTSWGSSTTTGFDGSYRLTGLQPGTYIVHFYGDTQAGSGSSPCVYDDQFYNDADVMADAQNVVVQRGSDVFVSPTTLRPPGTMRIHVVDVNGAPVAGASVEAWTGGNRGDSIDSTCQPTYMGGQTDATGTVSGSFRHGPDTVAVSAPGFFDALTSSYLRSDSTTDLTVALARPVLLDGTVVDAAGNPLSGVSVYGGTPAGPNTGPYCGTWTATSDSNGHWQSPPVHACQWQISFTDTDTSRPGGPYPTRYYPSTFEPTPDDNVTGTDGEHLTLQPETLIRGVMITGHLSTVDQQPAPNYTEIDFWHYTFAGTRDTGWMLNPDSSGNFATGPLDPGDYRVEFTNDAPYDVSWYRGAASEFDATVLHTSDGQTVDASDTLRYPPSTSPAASTTATSGGTSGASPTTTSAGTSSTLDSTPPTVTSTRVGAPVQLLTRLTFSYAATDTASGVADFDVRFRAAAWNSRFGPYTYPARMQHTTSTSIKMTGTPGHEYCFSVRARDHARNISAWSRPRCVAIALDDRALAAHGAWTRGTGPRYLHSTYSESTQRGATLRLANARVRRIALMVRTCPTCGNIAIRLNGTTYRTISTRSRTIHYRVLMLEPAFAPRTTTITLRVTTAGRPVYIDGVGVSR